MALISLKEVPQQNFEKSGLNYYLILKQHRHRQIKFFVKFECESNVRSNLTYAIVMLYAVDLVSIESKVIVASESNILIMIVT